MNIKCPKCKKTTSKQLFEKVIIRRDYGVNSDNEGYTHYLRKMILCSFCREDLKIRDEQKRIIDKIYKEIRNDEQLYQWMTNKDYHYIQQHYNINNKQLQKIIKLWKE